MLRSCHLEQAKITSVNSICRSAFSATRLKERCITREQERCFVKISTILEKIDEKQLFVPAFQREYVWKRDDAKQLIDSLIKEYPTGTMLIWETDKPPELKGPHKYNEKQGAVRLLLDGHSNCNVSRRTKTYGRSKTTSCSWKSDAKCSQNRSTPSWKK